VEWNFIPTGSGCRVDQTISYRPSTWIHGLIGRVEVGVKTRRNFLKTYAHIDRYLSDRNTTPFSKRRDDGINLGVQILTMFRDRLIELGLSNEIADRMATFILHSQPHDLVRIRPFQLAKLWGMDWLEVLSAFLRAARGGIFNVSWDLLCPRCRGAKLRARSLYDLEKQAHCETCNITYDANFDRSVELSFTVSPSVREVDIGEYCVGGPQNTPHILMQFRVPPGGKKTAHIPLSEGKYVFRSPHSKGRYILDVTSGSQAEHPSSESISGRSTNGAFRIDFSPENYKETFFEAPPGDVAFEIVNSHQTEIRVYLENAAWFEDACTAAFVTSLQEFRDLFSSEVLRPGQEIAVQNLTVLFTDLKGSTSMYKTVGDATAYSIVQDHFDALTDIVRKHMGGVVKTMGDAILAVFTKPEDGMRAAIEMHKAIQSVGLKGDKKEKLILKIGIHTGPCYAVNQNEKLDYFGSTLNVASRIEAHCEGGDILISEKMYESPAVQRVIRDSRKPVLKLTRSLRGFDEEFTLYQIKCLED
jgi:class 3 adenylate cyclase